MNTRKVLALLLALCMPVCAAWWDGTIGDLHLVTTASAKGQTTFTVTCSNPSVTAIRLTVIVLVPADTPSPDGSLYATITKTVDMTPRYFRGQSMGSEATVIMPVDESLIFVNPKIVKLTDQGTTQF